MLTTTRQIYNSTKKRHDQLFNTYVMRPLAAGVVALLAPTRVTPNQITLLNLFLFLIAAWLFAIFPTYAGGLLAVSVLELSYLFDCADGMLARYKKMASQIGHLFDFFTDELKAVVLVGALSIRFWRSGGYGINCAYWPAGAVGFPLAGVGAVTVVASAISLTNFVRRPELTGKETPIEAHYESTAAAGERPLRERLAKGAMTFLRFLNHYPSHLWLFALGARLDVFFWIYALLNALYLGRGWLGLALRLGR